MYVAKQIFRKYDEEADQAKTLQNRKERNERMKIIKLSFNAINLLKHNFHFERSWPRLFDASIPLLSPHSAQRRKKKHANDEKKNLFFREKQKNLQGISELVFGPSSIVCVFFSSRKRNVCFGNLSDQLPNWNEWKSRHRPKLILNRKNVSTMTSSPSLDVCFLTIFYLSFHLNFLFMRLHFFFFFSFFFLFVETVSIQ